MSILTLHAAVRTLLPSGIDHYEGQAPGDPEAPWLVTAFTAPDLEITEGVVVAGSTGEMTVTIAAETEDAANFWAARVDAALLGGRVAVGGWSVGALTPGGRVGPYPAGLTATDTNLRYQVIRLAWRFTYSTQ